MSAATELFDPAYDPAYDPAGDPRFEPVPAPRRHLAAVPADGDWSVPVRTAPAVAVPRSGSVSVLHAPAPTTTPLRLTRRGVVVLSLLVVAVGAVLVWLAALSNSPANPATGPGGAAAVPAAATSVTVEAGDTLWSIAGRVAPNADPRAEVEQLSRLNGIDDAGLVPGQQLRVR